MTHEQIYQMPMKTSEVAFQFRTRWFLFQFENRKKSHGTARLQVLWSNLELDNAPEGSARVLCKCGNLSRSVMLRGVNDFEMSKSTWNHNLHQVLLSIAISSHNLKNNEQFHFWSCSEIFLIFQIRPILAPKKSCIFKIKDHVSNCFFDRSKTSFFKSIIYTLHACRLKLQTISKSCR